jgi:hypothetical protein
MPVPIWEIMLIIGSCRAHQFLDPVVYLVQTTLWVGIIGQLAF